MKQVVRTFLALATAVAAATASASVCTTDDSQAQFQAGQATGLDLTSIPGQVQLATTSGGGTITVQYQTTTSGLLVTGTQWVAQTFTAAASGSVTRLDVELFCYLCSGATPSVGISLRATDANGLPTGSDLAASTTTVDLSGDPTKFSTINLGSPVAITAGQKYAILVHAVTVPTAGTLRWADDAGAGGYGGGTLLYGGGTSWTDAKEDGGFKVYFGSVSYLPSGNLISSTMDSAPVNGATPNWTTLSWTPGSQPANTTLKFQAAASSSSAGPFNFVGPDNTANTYFTTASGSALPAQFSGLRYLKYRAFLATANSAATPVLMSATVCNENVAPQADLSISVDDGVTAAAAGGSVTYTIVAANSVGPSGITGATVTDAFPSTLTCSWTCAGAGGGTCPASGSGSINSAVNLPKGGTATFTANCTISTSATGTLTNTASIAAPAGATDPTTTNNSALDSDTISSAPALRITLTDNTNTVRIGDVVNYVIEVTNGVGSGSANVTVTDSLPTQLTNGSWICTATGTASCGAAKGTGNSLSDAATVGGGGKIDYVYSATVVSADRTGLVSNSAALKTTGGASPTQNMNASDTDAVVVFAAGFDSNSTQSVTVNSAAAGASASMAAVLGVDGGLLTKLGVAPVTVATARSATGDKLFSLELSRAGKNVLMRSVTPVDGSDFSDVSPWQVVDLKQLRLGFEWRAATHGDDGLLIAGAAGRQTAMAASSSRAVPAKLDVATVNEVPWLVLVEQ